jgi:hypothetical protein
MSIGSAATAVDFRDSNKSITVDDTPRTYAGFNKIEISNAASRVDLSSVSIQASSLSITGSSPISKGDFQAVDNATINIDGCTFTDLGTFIFQSNSTVIGTTFRRCNQITQGGAAIIGSLVTRSTAAVALLADDISRVSDTEFVSGGTGHAVELNAAHAGGTFPLGGVDFTGYAAEGGSTGNEAIYNNSGGHVTLNVSGGNTPSIRNGAGSTTTVNSTVSLVISANVSLNGAEIRIYDNDGTPAGSYGSALAGTESHTSATYTYGGSAGNTVVIQIMLDGYEEYVQQYTMPGADSSLDVRLAQDNNA